MQADLSQLDLQDSVNRERALEHASFIVEAPAGAGKTELLTQRYLKLLATVQEPEEIVALTFTNKAAAEMRNRILLSLELAEQQAPETAPHKLKTRALANAALAQSHAQGWDLLQQPSRLRIQTMDSLCSSITRQMPLLSKFGGQPAVSDDTESHYLEAARRALAQVAHETDAEDTVTTALRYFDNNSEKLMALLAQMLAMRDQWLPLAGHLHAVDSDDLAKHTITALRFLITEALQEVAEVLPGRVQDALIPLARYAAANVDSGHDFAVMLDWQTALVADAGNLQQWQSLARFLLTQSHSYRKKLDYRDGFPATPEGRDKKDEYFAVVNGLVGNDTVARVLGLPAIESLIESQPVIQALTRLLMLAASHLWAVFQTAGEVDFVAIAQNAQQALENEQGATDLALKLDYRISHLLIDEFQDTSPVQMRLIEKLIEGWQPDDGRTLFCVGDPMQSIYRFRKADVSLFLQAANEGIGHLALTRLQLSRNNRSHPAVVGWINDAFKLVFPRQDNMQQGAISYRPFIATRPQIDGEGVHVHPLIVQTGDDEESPDTKQLEAAYVTELIAGLQQQNPQQKIAVLVRNRSHLRELVTEIRRNEPALKFQAVEIEHLNNRQTVQDAFSLICALQHRADRIHWLNVLRAPWCGLSLADLHALAADNHRATIWQLMQDEARLLNLTEQGRSRLLHVRQVLADAFNSQGRVPTRRWLEATWLRLGGGQCLVDSGDIRDVQCFFDLVEKVSHSGQLDIRALETGMQKLYARPDIEAPDTLQFLTIHKSKGLEFDTVILPALNRKPRNPDNALVLWQEVLVNHRMHLIAAPFTPKKNAADKKAAVSTYDFLKALETQRNDNEIVRLLYVAATRSERQLHLVATMQVNQKGELKPVANSMLEVLWPAVAATFSQATPANAKNHIAGLDIGAFIPKLQRLPFTAVQQLQARNLRPNAAWQSQQTQRTSSDNVAANLSEYLGEAALQRHCGTLAHLYMQLIAREPQAWTLDRLQACQNAMQAWLQQQGHAGPWLAAGVAHVLHGLQTTLGSEAGQWVLHAHQDAASELSLMQLATAEADLRNHVIDRTFVADGCRWIIDYKLTEFGSEKIMADDALSVMAEQHRPQLERYAGLYQSQGLPVRMAVLFLSSGKLVTLN